MSRLSMASTFALVAAACSAPSLDHRVAPVARAPAPAADPATAKPVIAPHPVVPSDWRMFVVEPMEAQVGPEHFMSAPPGDVLPNGDRLSRWPIYGSVVMQPK